MDWYTRVKRFYDQNLWTISQVADAVIYEKITVEQYKLITSDEFIQK